MSPAPVSIGNGVIPSSRNGLSTPPTADDVPNITPQNPPAAKTLVYSPDVRIKIAHNAKEYDVSGDIISCDVQRVENSASSISFVLSNKGQRYTGKTPPFAPMDRVLCYLKRISWIQVFSGYLDEVGYVTLYEGQIGFRGTCTLKRLMHTWWNPNLPASIQLFDQATVENQETDGKSQSGIDGGLGGLLEQLLIKAGGWSIANIHIQNFPTLFWNVIQDQYLKESDPTGAAVDSYKHLLLGSDISPGAGGSATDTAATTGASSPANGSAIGGAGASSAVGAGQAFYLAEIVRAVDEMGLGPQVSDIKQAQAQQAVGESGSQGVTRDEKAWIDTTTNAKTAQTNERGSDAAILACMCVLVESSFLMYASNGVPESLNYHYDAIGHDHSSIGLFQQQNFKEWGSVAQRMNPHDSAVMFLQHLVNIQGWRNMDPGSAVQAVQRSANPGAYSNKQAIAVKMVQAYRSSQPAQVASGAAASPLGDATSTVPGASTAISSVQTATNTNTSPAPGALNPATSSPLSPNVAGAVGKPSPDSEGAVQYATQCIGLPYEASAGPAAYDCSGLWYAAYNSIGINIGRNTYAQMSALASKKVPASQIQRGDLIYLNGGEHVVGWLGGGMILQSSTYGQPIAPKPAYFDLNGGSGHWTVCGIYHVCDNGGVNPAAAHNPPGKLGTGVPPSAVNSTTADGGTGQAALGGAGGEPIAHNLFSYMYDASSMIVDAAALMYAAESPERAFIDGQPLIQAVAGMAKAGLRSFASAGNGDFIAYYPDYFGLDGKPAVLDLEDIELVDVRLNWSDDPLATHVYINGNSVGGYAVGPAAATQTTEQSWLSTAGIATVENESLFARMLAVAPGEPEHLTGQQIVQKYGVRPYMDTYSMAGSKELEFLCAVQVFMTQWAKQYQTSIQLTFMPELMPGMRINLVGHDLQVYVTAVNHHCDFSGGFTTTASIMAPSNPNARKLLKDVAAENASINNAPGVGNSVDYFFQGDVNTTAPVISADPLSNGYAK